MKKKSLNATKKVNLKVNFHEIYKVFKSKILKKVLKRNFAVAVSGGPDSLCLSYLSKKYGDEYGNKIKYFIVDHKLRKDSSKEAIFVKKLLKREAQNWFYYSRPFHSILSSNYFPFRLKHC